MGKYDDILYLKRPASRRHPPMPLSDRAAQFLPFSALVGYDAIIEETGRLTEKEKDLTEEEREVLDYTLAALSSQVAAGETPLATVTIFTPDARKEGGAYDTFTGALTNVDYGKRILCFQADPHTAERQVSLDQIVRLEPV